MSSKRAPFEKERKRLPKGALPAFNRMTLDIAHRTVLDQSKSKSSRKTASKKGSLKAESAHALSWTSVDSMRPTQCSVGFLEVELKSRELAARAQEPDELRKYLLGHPIPAVLGPDARMYLVDHHHMGLAMLRLENLWDASAKPAALNPFRHCRFEIVEDFSAHSTLCMAQFFSELEARGLAHPYDGEGLRTSALKTSLETLDDDPYRSLAGIARKAGAFRKVSTPYIEFKWANFFRSRIPVHLIAAPTLATVVERACELARSEAARALPGWIAPSDHAPMPTLARISERLARRHGADDSAPGLAHQAAGLART